ncbi:recombination protein NinB [Caldimonas sp. KR1-144]|uniref:recombination protein NinB n=1 Tax=Caldimonas sp. KR1-144 TaxID=3400911 RepID=UPI003BFB268E
MSERRFFVLAHPEARRRAHAAIDESPDDYTVLIASPSMNDGQKQRFHAMCGDFAKSGLIWDGRERTASEWKVLLISGHAKATGDDVEFVRGLEGELVNVRESTTTMSRRRGASLIEYGQAFAAMNGIRLNDPRLKELEREYGSRSRQPA